MNVALKELKNNTATCLMGDLNARVGGEKDGDLIGNYGLDARNERGGKLVQFCLENNLAVMNTLTPHLTIDSCHFKKMPKLKYYAKPDLTKLNNAALRFSV